MKRKILMIAGEYKVAVKQANAMGLELNEWKFANSSMLLRGLGGMWTVMLLYGHENLLEWAEMHEILLLGVKAGRWEIVYR